MLEMTVVRRSILGLLYYKPEGLVLVYLGQSTDSRLAEKESLLPIHIPYLLPEGNTSLQLGYQICRMYPNTSPAWDWAY
jgi:hypothetical protein